MSKAIRRIFWLGICCTLLSGGCALLPRSERGPRLEVEFDQVLPDGWEAIGNWRSVNLDGDEAEENLLFFRFDSGQIGALIYDAQLAPAQPYRLLPRYFDDRGALGQGVIAPPGIDPDAITLYQMDGQTPSRELVIRGSGTHLTFVWWEGEAKGYGVTQLYAPGGFSGLDWDEWERTPAPIQSLVGYYPLDDYRARSRICRTIEYTRRSDLSYIAFAALSQGLQFCDGAIPDHPFSPEGVVLAYLLWPRPADTGLSALLTSSTTLPQVDAESAMERLPFERIDDIAAYAAVPLSLLQLPAASEQNAQAPGAELPSVSVFPTTSVCVEMVERANPKARRWVVFTLQYQPPDEAQQLPDHWTISGAHIEPPSVEPSAVGYCSVILARNAP
jgi:hypothetical protein